MPDPQLLPGRLCEDRQKLSIGRNARMERKEEIGNAGGALFSYNLEGQRPGASTPEIPTRSGLQFFFFFFPALSNGDSDATKIR